MFQKFSKPFTVITIRDIQLKYPNSAYILKDLRNPVTPGGAVEGGYGELLAISDQEGLNKLEEYENQLRRQNINITVSKIDLYR